MKNLISERVADFLKKYPPFHEMHERDLLDLGREIIISYREKGSVIFQKDDRGHDTFYVVHKGAVDLRLPPENIIMDICDEGDIFGLRPLMANENYKLEARTREDTILYGIPIVSFKPYIQSYEELGNFIIESFASNTRNPYSREHTGKLMGSLPYEVHARSDERHLDLQLLRYRKKIVTCPKSATAKQIARLMTDEKVGSVLVVAKGLPVGIITDKDLRTCIISGDFPVSTKAESIMSSPVITYPIKLTVSQAQMAMMKNDIDHLCLTKDGTPASKAMGMVSMHDVMVAMGNNPAAFIKAIKRADKMKQLKPVRHGILNLLRGYLEENIPMSITLKIIAELNDACIKQIIKIALRKMPSSPKVAFAWLAMGSQGRGEQLLNTDQDNALIFEDVPAEALATTREYFLELARRITKGLNEIGFDYCPADMMASNPSWCMALEEWKTKITEWITNPGKEEILLSAIFYDYNFMFGNEALVNDLSDHLFEEVEKYPLFAVHLAGGAMQNPSPTGFFRQFLVEQDGKYKDYFDLKRRALMPLTDAARVLILIHHVRKINNTSDRFEKLAELEPNNQELFLSCSYAVKALIKFRTRQGLMHGDSGRFIALDKLGKAEKIKLKSTFKTVSELQELLAIRFHTSTLL